MSMRSSRWQKVRCELEGKCARTEMDETAVSEEVCLPLRASVVDDDDSQARRHLATFAWRYDGSYQPHALIPL